MVEVKFKNGWTRILDSRYFQDYVMPNLKHTIYTYRSL